MKKLLFLTLLIPQLVYSTSDKCVFITSVQEEEQIIQITLSDKTIWSVIDQKGFNIHDWKNGQHVCFYRPADYASNEYRIINMDQVSCTKVIFAGRVN